MKKFSSCIFIILDGAREDVFASLLEEGKLPHLQKYIIEKGTFGKAVSVFPSTTGPAYLPFLTGCYPGRCNIPGIRWFDRDRYQNSRFGLTRFRSYVGPESCLVKRDLTKEVKTVFEIVPHSFNVYNFINRGTSFFSDKTKMVRLYYAATAHFSHNWLKVDKMNFLHTRELLKKRPQFVFTVFPAVDELSHLTTPTSELVFNTYYYFDYCIGKLIDELKKYQSLEEVLFFIVSDHGLSEIHTHFDLIGFFNSLGYKTFYYPLVFKRDFDLAVMQSGNSMAHVYLKRNSDWRERSFFSQLENIIDKLVAREEVELVICRKNENEICIFAQEGKGFLSKKDEKFNYVFSGEDPLRINRQLTVSEDESLRLTFNLHFPDAFCQLWQLFDSPRTGDLIITAREGYDLREKYENPEHFSTHGGLRREHMIVPFATNYKLPNCLIRTVDFLPTILNLLGIENNFKFDGKNILDRGMPF